MKMRNAALNFFFGIFYLLQLTFISSNRNVFCGFTIKPDVCSFSKNCNDCLQRFPCQPLVNHTSPPHPKFPDVVSIEVQNKVGRLVWFWFCFRPAFSGCYQLTSVCVCVCVCRGWQEEFVLLSGSLKSSSSLDLKPGLMTRLIHWHLCAALSLSEPLHTPAAKHTRDLPASPRECESLAHAGVLKVSCAWDSVRCWAVIELISYLSEDERKSLLNP